MKTAVKLLADPYVCTAVAAGLVALTVMLRVYAGRVLNGIYLAGGIIGAMFLVAILVIIVINMVLRNLSSFDISIPFPGSTDYAGYCMAGSSFFALAYALNKGAHIRVNLILSRMGTWRRFGEIWCYGIAALMALVFARYALKMNVGSVRWNDISQGLDKTPMYIPQIAMSIGAVLLAMALVDHLVRLLTTNHEGVEVAALGEGEA